jgi:hypothetical protein
MMTLNPRGYLRRVAFVGGAGRAAQSKGCMTEWHLPQPRMLCLHQLA